MPRRRTPPHSAGGPCAAPILGISAIALELQPTAITAALPMAGHRPQRRKEGVGGRCMLPVRRSICDPVVIIPAAVLAVGLQQPARWPSTCNPSSHTQPTQQSAGLAHAHAALLFTATCTQHTDRRHSLQSVCGNQWRRLCTMTGHALEHCRAAATPLHLETR